MEWIDLEVTADPDSCRRTARQLARLAGACGTVADHLVRHTHLHDADFSGLAADAFVARCRASATGADRRQAWAERLAAALEEYADGVDEVRTLMREARRAAEPWLVTSATRIESPARPACGPAGRLADRWAAWRHAVGLWREARELEDRAERALRDRLHGSGPQGPASYDGARRHPGPHRHDDPLPVIEPPVITSPPVAPPPFEHPLAPRDPGHEHSQAPPGHAHPAHHHDHLVLDHDEHGPHHHQHVHVPWWLPPVTDTGWTLDPTTCGTWPHLPPLEPPPPYLPELYEPPVPTEPALAPDHPTPLVR